MDCPNCGALLETKVRFCPVCGFDVTGKSFSHEPTNAPVKSGIGWFKILLVVALLICGVLFFMGYEESDPKDVVRQQLSALQTNRITEAYYAYTSKDFQKVTSLEKFKEFVKSYPLITQIKTIDLRVKEGANEDVKIVEGDLVTQNRKILPVEYQMVLENSQWRILYMRFLTNPTQTITPAPLLPGKTNKGATVTREDLMPVIKAFLESLKNNQIAQAYGKFTSKPFQDTTTLEAFRQFLEAYPILESFGSYQFGEYTVGGSKASINVELIQGNLKAAMAFSLDKENGDWKIQAIKHLEQMENKANMPDFDSTKLSAVIQGQLRSLKQGEIERAYYDFTSNYYRQGTTLDQFTQFVHANPVLTTNVSMTFEQLQLNNNVASFTCTLKSAGGISTKVDYDLVLEGGFWKISKMHLQGNVDESGTTLLKPLEFDKAVFGTQVDDTGLVLDPSMAIKTSQSDIYVNLYVKKATTGDIVQFQLEYLDSGTKIPVSAYTMPQNGDQRATFSFTPPPDGWPKGKYQLTVDSLSGVERVFPFSIE